MTLETEILLFKRVELGQENILSRNEILQFYVIYGDDKNCLKKNNKHRIFNLTAAISRFSLLLPASCRMNTS